MMRGGGITLDERYAGARLAGLPHDQVLSENLLRSRPTLKCGLFARQSRGSDGRVAERREREAHFAESASGIASAVPGPMRVVVTYATFQFV